MGKEETCLCYGGDLQTIEGTTMKLVTPCALALLITVTSVYLCQKSSYSRKVCGRCATYTSDWE